MLESTNKIEYLLLYLSQRQDLLNVIQEFETKDFESEFAKKYADTATIDSVVVTDYSVAEFFALARKAVSQLKNRLMAADWQVLPITQNLNEYGNCNINVVLKNITSFLRSCNYEPALTNTKSLVYYEMLNGFWIIPNRIELGVRESTLAKLETRAALMMTHIEERQDSINKLIENVNTIREGLNAYKQEKELEFKTLQQNQNHSNAIAAELNTLKAQANDGKTNIDSLNTQCEAILKKLKEEQETIVKMQTQIDEHNKSIEETNKQLKEAVDTESKTIKQTYETTVEYKNEILKMMQYIADGTLSHSFHQRKKETTNSMRWWIGGVIISLVILVGWIYVVFTYWPANTGNEWANIIINAIKSSPMAFMFAYALTQLSKERTIQEEYAYREAVALTLTAYLEQLDKEDNEDKKNLLLQTIEKLYSKPIIYNSNSQSSIKINSKDLTELLTNLTEAIKAIKQ